MTPGPCQQPHDPTQLEVAARMMKNADEADRCWMSDHDGQIEMWKQRATSAEGTCEKWWTERFAAGMEAMRPDMEAAERRAAEMEAQVRELTLWRDAVLTRSEP